VMFQAGAGPTGGECVLHWNSPTGNDDPAKDMLKLNANDWVCLSGVQTGATGVVVSRFARFRVTHCDREPSYNGSPAAGFSSAGYELNCSLTGPDWNVSLVNPKVPTVLNTASAMGSHRLATSAIDVAGRPPSSASLAFFAASMSNPTTSKPAPMSRCANAWPSRPRPIRPTG